MFLGVLRGEEMKEGGACKHPPSAVSRPLTAVKNKISICLREEMVKEGRGEELVLLYIVFFFLKKKN